MIIVGILFLILGFILHRFLNKSDKPAIAVYQWVHSIPTLLYLLGVILFIIGIIKSL